MQFLYLREEYNKFLNHFFLHIGAANAAPKESSLMDRNMTAFCGLKCAKSSLLFSFLLAMSSLSAGCAELTNTAEITEISNPIDQSYPIPGSDIEDAYPPSASQSDVGDEGPTAIPPNDAPAPIDGMAAISGQLYSYTIQQVIPETGYYLTKTIGSDNAPPPLIVGPRDDHGDIQGRSDTNGIIYRNDVPPGKYYLIVWSPYNWAIAQVSETDASPKLIELQSGDRMTLGKIFLSWP